MIVLETIGEGLWNAFQMAWEVGWALVLGFLLSGMVQAWVPRSRMERALGGRALRSVARATGLGAASSSCSYAAVAIAKSMFQKGASLATAMAFQFASTNLVFEIGIVMWVFLGWEFTLAEFLGGLVLIVLMWIAMRVFVSRRLETEARAHAVEAHAQAAQTGHEHHSAGSGGLSWRQRMTSVRAWSDVAHNFRGDWEMLWKEITAGFVIAGFIALLPMDFFNALFLTDETGWLPTLENVIVGALVAVLSFVCSVGNVPLAAVLWAGGISFGGVISFIYADLIVIPILLIYRKYYGTKVAALITSIMFGAIVLAALLVQGIFDVAGLIPETRPDVESITERGIGWNYTTFLNILFLGVAAILIALTLRSGARDPVCGMTVDRLQTQFRSEWGGKTYYFCSEGCKTRFDANPEEYLGPSRPKEHAHAHH